MTVVKSSHCALSVFWYVHEIGVSSIELREEPVRCALLLLEGFLRLLGAEELDTGFVVPELEHEVQFHAAIDARHVVQREAV